MAFSKKVDYIKALFMGYIFTPVFFVIYNVISYQMHHYLLYRGEPLSIHEIVEWLLMLNDKTNQPLALFVITISWLSGWLLAWSRSRSLVAVLSAIVSAYVLYILYLVAFWRVQIIINIPEDLIPIGITMIIVSISALIRKIKPKKTIFDKLVKAGYVFPEHWKKPIDIPTKCPHCGATLLSNPTYCWNCGSKIEEV